MAGSMSYHMEARIKQDRMNKWNDQKRRAEFGDQTLAPKHEDVAYNQQMGKVITADAGQFHKIRIDPLPLFRVNLEGYKNRYRNRQHLNPHVDKAFVTIYTGSDNSDYTSSECQVNRRLNSAVDKYHVSRKVNGEFSFQRSREPTMAQ